MQPKRCYCACSLKRTWLTNFTGDPQLPGFSVELGSQLVAGTKLVHEGAILIRGVSSPSSTPASGLIYHRLEGKVCERWL